MYGNVIKLGFGTLFTLILLGVLLFLEPQSLPRACEPLDPILSLENCYISTEELWRDPHGYDGRTVVVFGNLTFNIEDFSIWSGARTRDEYIWVSYSAENSDQLLKREKLNTDQHCIYTGMVRGVFSNHTGGHMGIAAAELLSADLLDYSLDACYEGTYAPIEG